VIWNGDRHGRGFWTENGENITVKHKAKAGAVASGSSRKAAACGISTAGKWRAAFNGGVKESRASVKYCGGAWRLQATWKNRGSRYGSSISILAWATALLVKRARAADGGRKIKHKPYGAGHNARAVGASNNEYRASQRLCFSNRYRAAAQRTKCSTARNAARNSSHIATSASRSRGARVSNSTLRAASRAAAFTASCVKARWAEALIIISKNSWAWQLMVGVMVK